jgi:predicted nucleic acid-binding protein
MATLREDSEMLVWYATALEIESAICRREREGSLSSTAADQIRALCEQLSQSWIEVQPGGAVRARAKRLLRLHPLRTADAFQLAAALIAFQEQPAGQHFLTSDERLKQAARTEGFLVD